MIHDPEVATARALRMAQNSAVESTTGKQMIMPIDTICVHADLPGAVATATLVRQTLEGGRIGVTGFIKAGPRHR